MTVKGTPPVVCGDTGDETGVAVVRFGVLVRAILLPVACGIGLGRPVGRGKAERERTDADAEVELS